MSSNLFQCSREDSAQGTRRVRRPDWVEERPGRRCRGRQCSKVTVRVAFVDTERDSAKLYADHFDFDVLALRSRLTKSPR